MNIHEIAEQIRTQDNACTDKPMFVVQSRKRSYGLDDAYSDSHVWITADECEEVTDEDEIEKLDLQYEETGVEPDNYIRTMFMDIWEHKTTCLTRKGAEDYIEEMSHHMTDPRIYVESGYRNREWEVVRDFLKTL